ncbi:PAS domain S-box-containing protein [Malonomonas rubra DSM 5091]|uniref:histidine kinase n=1 Tax=Malonomonas rubra DSM 5091 TaxID=1122189 RepID=A0A1M6B8I3_MALRU|nr:PAS domain S-box protein [Malonomonas rubra]SHI45049.1 PAS domain S-box-containing protein [Malonomonas rubra DSM 5091]
MKIDYSLKDALSWRFVVVSILPLLIVSIVSFDFFSRETEHRLTHENQSAAESIAAKIALDLQEPHVLVREIGRFCKFFPAKLTGCNSYLDQIVNDNHSIDSVFVLNAVGRVVATGLPIDFRKSPADYIGQDFSLLPQVKNVRSGSGVAWSEAFFSQEDGRISVALTNKIDEGLIVAYVNVDHLNQRFMPLPGQQPAHLLLLDHSGQLVFQFPQAAAPELLDLQHLEPAKSALTGGQHTAHYELGGKDYLGTAIQMPDVGWVVLYGQEYSGLLGIVWRLKIILVSSLMLAFVLASLWSRTLARKIVRPISDLAQSAESFAEGDYRHPLPYGNHLEIDCLSDSFRLMRQTIDEREKLLLQNKEYFSRLFNGVTDAILVSKRFTDGTPGSFVEVNDVACRLLGYSRQELLEKTPYNLNRISQDDPEEFRRVLDEITEKEQVLFKTELLTSNGDWLPVEIGCQLFELDGQQVFFSVARDITLREKYESSIKTLVRSTVGLTGQDCLDEIVQNLCDWLNADGASIGLVSGERMKIQAGCLHGELKNPFSLQLAGTPYKEILDGNYIFHTEDAASRYPALSQFKLAGIQSFIGIPMVGHNGQILGAVSAFSRNAMIAVPHVEELLSVIASRAAAECERLDYVRELAHSEEMLRTLFNSTAEAIVGIDLSGECVFCNPSTLRMLGYDDEAELIGESFCELVDNERMRELIGSDSTCPFMTAIESEEKLTGSDGVLKRKDGREVPVEFWGHRMMRDGELIGGVITFIDISRRRTLEKQLQHSQRMEAVGTLTGGIAHDFNNILTVISGYAGLLQSLYADDRQLLPKISKIAEAADRGSKLTHGLLAYSRKKTGPLTPVDLNRLVLNVQDLFGKAIGEHIEKQLTLSKQQLFVQADTSQLEQVLVNLATNARDAMPGGGVLKISTEPASIDKDFCQVHGYGEPGNYALIKVEDTGIGMSPNVLQNIFDPFFTTKDTGKGTGLGLAIAWGIVKQHKGYILVDSKDGEGSCFSIYLPLTNKRPLQKPAVDTGHLPGGTETVLLVEDDPQVLETTFNILHSVGYKVLTGNCAESALAILDERKEELDLILSDVVMPGIKGIEFYQEIRKRTELPVIFISGYTFDALRDQGLVGDDIILLNKPISPFSLLTKIRDVIDLK